MKAKKLLSLVLASSMTFAAAVTAVNADDDIVVLLDSMELTFDVPPQIIESRTVVPYRAIFEALGFEVGWDQDTQTVSGTKGDLEIEMVIGKTEATVKNNAADASEPEKTVTFDVPPQIVDGRTLVPVRAVGEMSGYKVDWDEKERKVLIVTPIEMLTGPGPAVTSPSPNPATQTEPGPAVPSESPNPTTQNAPGPAVSEFPITYDDTNEQQSHSVRYFELLSVEKNAEGKYDITFTLKTFFEGRGTVAATFDCLDENGKVVDTITGSYIGSDYAWTPHEDKATISGDTVKIVFRSDK